MESVAFGGRTVAGFALGDRVGVGDAATLTSPTYAALMTGAAAGLLAHTLRVPTWGAILLGAAAATTTKYTIDRAAA